MILFFLARYPVDSSILEGSFECVDAWQRAPDLLCLGIPRLWNNPFDIFAVPIFFTAFLLIIDYHRLLGESSFVVALDTQQSFKINDQITCDLRQVN